MDRLALPAGCPAIQPAIQVGQQKCSGGERGQANDREGEAEDCGAGFAAWLFAVKATVDFLTQFLDFSGIVRICHSLGKFGQFFTGQLAFSRQFHGESYDLGLFAGRQLLDFFNDACCGHAQKILEIPPHSNAFSESFRFHRVSAQHVAVTGLAGAGASTIRRLKAKG